MVYPVSLLKSIKLMRAILLKAGIFLATAFLLFGCKDQLEEFKTEPPSDYYPLQAGKYITYRLDSTVFTNLGRTQETHTYQEKHTVDAQITDNLGRTAYRVFRYLRDSAGSGGWQPAGSYMVTPLQNSVEVSENNLRTIKLYAPLKEGTVWKGGRYLATDPYSTQYSFSNDDNMNDWDFTVEAVAESLTLNGKTVNDVITVKGIDESFNVPITDARLYASKSYAVEKYAKGLGLVYQELVLWEYQPNPTGASPYTIGFGVKRSLLDHN